MDTEKIGSKNLMLAFFPWLRIDQVTDIGNWELTPIAMADLGNSESDLNIKQVLKPYHFNAKAPVQHAVLLRRKDKGQFDLLSEDEMSDYFLISEVLSLSAVASREFFSWNEYTNSSSYALTIQRFQSHSDGVAVVSRRRDGSNTNYIPGEYNLVIQPNHVVSGRMLFDLPLTEAILKAQSDGLWSNIHESIFCYLRANTDDTQTQQQAELMFTMGAFERLFNINSGSCADSAKAFVSAMEKVLIEEDRPKAIGRDLGKLSGFKSTREAWLRDLCICRGDMAHGRTKQSYKSVWSPQEHMLLASDIYPIALKSALMNNGLYTLTEEDRQRLFYFDRRLRVANLYGNSHDLEDRKFGWNEAREIAVWEWLIVKDKLIPNKQLDPVT